MHRRLERRSLLILTMGLLACAVFGELFLGAIDYSYPVFVAWSPDRGHHLRPGARGRWTYEGHAHVRINRHGFRDRDRLYHAPTGTYRIAVLGDSFTEGRQVEVDSTYCAVLERELNAHLGTCRGDDESKCEVCGHEAVEVLNFGVSGYGTGEELLTLRSMVWRFEPDLVLLQFTAANDVADNDRGLEFPHRPVFEVKNGVAVLDRGFEQRPPLRGRYPRLFGMVDQWRNRSRVWQLFWEGQVRLRGTWRRWNHGPLSAGRIDSGVSPQVRHSLSDSTWESAWEVTEALLVTMRNEVEGKGARFRFCCVGTGEQLAFRPHENRAGSGNTLGELDYVDRRLETFAEREGIPFLALSGPMRKSAHRENIHPHGFGERLGQGHWNERGHALAGALLGSWILGRDPMEAKEETRP